MDLEQFRNPPSQYRSAPFWSWNGILTEEELVRQVREFHRVGIGGFFMHSRVGLQTPYMDSEWMACVEGCVREAARLGMKAWLYDEDSYPSGFAGGMVPSLGADYRAKSLHHEITRERPAMRDGTVAVFRCRLDGDRPISAVRDDGLRRAPGERFLHLYWALPPESGWHNDTTYVDTLNRDACDAFLRVTHDAYADRVGGAFGGAVPGIFTDEPRLTGPLPWTTAFPAEFQARKGYDIRDRLPALLYRIGDDWPKVRYDYWHVVTALFIENWCQPIYDWCEKNGIASTGHYWEHTYPSPTIMGDFMAPYAAMQVPGIDCLGFAYENRDHPQFGYLPMMKEVTSVAHQFGRPQVLSEAYGGSGWDFNFASQKWYWDWHLVNGVNLLCQHLSLYDMRGVRKRDYPPSFRDHQPWWPHYRVLGDYVGRLGYALSQGDHAANVLVLHPCEGSWIEFDPVGGAMPRDARDALWDLTKTMVEMKCEFDYGSEWLLAEHGRVRKGRLAMGSCAYDTVVLPPMVSMRRSTLDLLRRFIEGGGTVVVTGKTPVYLDGAQSQRPRAFLASKAIVRCRPTRAGLARALPKPAVQVLNSRGSNIPVIFAHRRKLRGRQLVFLASMDGERAHKATVLVPDAGPVELWDAETGEVHSLRSRKQGACRAVELEFAPHGSHLLSIGRRTKAATPLPPAPPKARKRLKLKRSWTSRRLGPNALVLDFAQHRVGGGRWSRRLPIHEAQLKAATTLGVPWEQGGRGCQFWKAYQGMKNLGPEARVEVRYEFESALSPAAAVSLQLVVEDGDRFEARVNGKAVAFAGWWRERSFRAADIGHLVKPGKNVVELAIRFRQDVELEPSYLVGDFAVGKDRVLVDEGRTLRNGDWTRQGYPHYADGMAYEQTVELDDVPASARLCFDRLDAIVSRVLVNGQEAGLVYQRPLETDVAGLLRQGENTVTVEVYPSLRNLLGPLHYAGPKKDITGPWDFFAHWSDEYQLVPYGLAGDVWLAW